MEVAMVEVVAEQATWIYVSNFAAYTYVTTLLSSTLNLTLGNCFRVFLLDLTVYDLV